MAFLFLLPFFVVSTIVSTKSAGILSTKPAPPVLSYIVASRVPLVFAPGINASPWNPQTQTSLPVKDAIFGTRPSQTMSTSYDFPFHLQNAVGKENAGNSLWQWRDDAGPQFKNLPHTAPEAQYHHTPKVPDISQERRPSTSSGSVTPSERLNESGSVPTPPSETAQEAETEEIPAAFHFRKRGRKKGAPRGQSLGRLLSAPDLNQRVRVSGDPVCLEKKRDSILLCQYPRRFDFAKTSEKWKKDLLRIVFRVKKRKLYFIFRSREIAAEALMDYQKEILEIPRAEGATIDFWEQKFDPLKCRCSDCSPTSTPVGPR